MKIFVVYAHPSSDSFTSQAKDSFIQGLEEAGHSYVISDLYKMNFRTDMSETEYFREANYRTDLPLSADVLAEQEKINTSDGLVFIFPVFWADVPAKLKGWFDRVWTYGFAYGDNRSMKTIEKGLVICSAGNTAEMFKKTGQYDCLKTAMLSDRLFDRVKTKELLVLHGTSKENPSLLESNRQNHLKTVYESGLYW